MRIKVSQQPDKGILGGPKSKEFNVRYNERNYEISIRQLGVREITITCSDPCSYKDCLGVYYYLISLLMLFDGQFYPITRAFENDTEITASMKERALVSYTSADFMLYRENKLIDFENAISDQMFSEWCVLKDELDINYNMVLYCLSSIKLPIDVKCAFLIESFKGLYEIVNEKRPECVLHSGHKGTLRLGECLKDLLK